MTETKTAVAYQDILPLAVPPALAREFIMAPDRILDYFPEGLGGGVIEPGQSIYCYSEAVVSLLEMVASDIDNVVTIKVTTAAKTAEPPFTEEQIKTAAFFTMYEDWQLDATDTGTRLTKTWRNIETLQPDMPPMDEIVRESAKEEGAKLVTGWNKAGKK